MAVAMIEKVITPVYKYPKKDFMCDTSDEISKLPKYGVEGTVTGSSDKYINEPIEYGSSAIVKTGEIYFLWPDNTWAPF